MVDRQRLRVGVIIAALCVIATIVTKAQQEPVATMFRDDLKRAQTLSESFLPIEVPAAGSAAPLHVYLSAGDLELAFDRAAYRPDGAIIPTNTSLLITAASPTTQRVLVDRVSKRKPALTNLQDQVEARRKQAGNAGALQIGVDSFVATLPARGGGQDEFPKWVCFIATDFATGGAVDRRELFAQDRVRKGVAACLTAMDQAGATSVVMPLLGAASAKTQEKDPVFEGQRQLKECRQINSAAGIALGIHDFAASRRSIREVGIVQWDREITDMFRGSRLAQAAYRQYAEQVKHAVNKGIAGEKTTAADVEGNCAAIFDATPGKD